MASVVLQSEGSISSDTASRIVGGEYTTSQKYHFIVEIVLFNTSTNSWNHHCGGNIITVRYILTVAHCCYSNLLLHEPSLLMVRVGSASRHSGGRLHKVCKIHLHAAFHSISLDSDIAILRLCDEIRLGKSVALVVLPKQSAVFEVPDDDIVMALGWGLTEEGIYPEMLKKVSVKAMNRAICRARLKLKIASPITDNMLCAGLLDGGVRHACIGDAGGPLLWNDILVGLVSFDDEICSNRTIIGVYTHVSRYVEWINLTVEISSARSSLEFTTWMLVVAVLLSVNK